jgi:integrase
MADRLTDAAIRNSKRQAKAYKVPDSNGLFLLVQPNGSRLWRYRYRIAGKENLYALGEYGDDNQTAVTMSLSEARKARDAARELVKQGIHPAAHRKVSRIVAAHESGTTFAAIARELVERRRGELGAEAIAQVNRIFANDVFPHIGALPIKAVKAAHLLAILKRIEARGAPTIALQARRWCSAVFCYAIATLRAEADPAATLKGAVARPRTQHKKTLSQKQLPTFLADLEKPNGARFVQIILQLLLLTFVRPSELRCATWDEFDLEGAVWRIPAARMKMGEPHIVPLSDDAVTLLRELKETAQGRALLFPNVRDPLRPMSRTTLNRALERLGYGGRFSAHGFRGTASTLLNEMGYRPDVIERQLAHKERNKVRGSYNHANYLPEREAMMRDWANYLNQLRRGDKIIPFRKVAKEAV